MEWIIWTLTAVSTAAAVASAVAAVVAVRASRPSRTGGFAVDKRRGVATATFESQPTRVTKARMDRRSMGS